jgi:hypothetical protein
MADDRDIERRIRERAYRLWEAEGRPEGRAAQHWEQARMIVALEDGQRSTLKPVEPPKPEPVTAIENQGEFPTLTDQGEERVYPMRRRVGDVARAWSAWRRSAR